MTSPKRRRAITEVTRHPGWVAEHEKRKFAGGHPIVFCLIALITGAVLTALFIEWSGQDHFLVDFTR